MMYCSCGRRAIVTTSWTDTNPGRRFWGCPTPKSKCPFIGWYDPPMCDRAVLVIPGLLRSMNKLQDSLEKMKEETENMKGIQHMQEDTGKLKWVLGLSWFFFVIVMGIMMY